ncbi:MAG: GFA family protein [Deltaproteobacteria bacterium]|nr:MAG: GFA family protein [Deltaproteobacteria bacterium]
MNCHCSMCRKQHGAAYATFIGTQTENVTILSGEDKLTRYRSSEHVERCFCAQCGSSLLFYYSPRPELMWFAAGALDESPEFAPQEHIYVGSKAPWHTITDDLPQYKTYPSQEGNEQNG